MTDLIITLIVIVFGGLCFGLLELSRRLLEDK